MRRLEKSLFDVLIRRRSGAEDGDEDRMLDRYLCTRDRAGRDVAAGTEHASKQEWRASNDESTGEVKDGVGAGAGAGGEGGRNDDKTDVDTWRGGEEEEEDAAPTPPPPPPPPYMTDSIADMTPAAKALVAPLALALPPSGAAAAEEDEAAAAPGRTRLKL